jgi:hypothetical protein
VCVCVFYERARAASHRFFCRRGRASPRLSRCGLIDGAGLTGKSSPRTTRVNRCPSSILHCDGGYRCAGRRRRPLPITVNTRYEQKYRRFKNVLFTLFRVYIYIRYYIRFGERDFRKTRAELAKCILSFYLFFYTTTYVYYFILYSRAEYCRELCKSKIFSKFKC